MPGSELRGLLYLTASSLVFVVMSAFIKVLSQTLPQFEVSFLRSLLSIPFFLFIVRGRAWKTFASIFTIRFFARSAFGYANFVAYVFCLSKLPLSTASALFYTAPVWSFLLSILVLKERHAIVPAVTLAFGFLGMLLIVQPSIVQASPWIVVGLAGALSGSIAVMMVRRIAANEGPDQVALGFMIWSVVIGLPLAAPQWIWPTSDQVVSLCLVGLLAMIAQVGLTRGYALAPLARGAPFDFVRLPASVLIGLVYFAEFPTTSMWVGAMIILAGSLIALSESYWKFFGRTWPRTVFGRPGQGPT